MPGFSFVQESTQSAPYMLPFILGKSQNIYAGDVVVISTNSAVEPASSTPGIRTLLAADKSAHYNGGILGVAISDCVTNASGQPFNAVAPGGVTTGGVVYSLPSIQALNGPDPASGAGLGQVLLASGLNTFAGYLTSGSAVANQALVGTFGGITLTGTNPTIFNINTTDSTSGGPGTGNLVVYITGVDIEDPLYNAHGGRVFFKFVAAFDALTNALSYSAQ